MSFAGHEHDPGRRPQGPRELIAALGACQDYGRWTRGDAESWWASWTQ